MFLRQEEVRWPMDHIPALFVILTAISSCSGADTTQGLVLTTDIMAANTVVTTLSATPISGTPMSTSHTNIPSTFNQTTQTFTTTGTKPPTTLLKTTLQRSSALTTSLSTTVSAMPTAEKTTPLISTSGEVSQTTQVTSVPEGSSTIERSSDSSETVTMVTGKDQTGGGVTDLLSVVEWFLIAVAIAAVIFFLFILCHFCQMKKKARTHSEQNKHIIEYASPQSPKEKWRNSWALEAMIYHIEIPEETNDEMEARINTVYEEDETDSPSTSNNCNTLTRL